VFTLTKSPTTALPSCDNPVTGPQHANNCGVCSAPRRDGIGRLLDGWIYLSMPGAAAQEQNIATLEAITIMQGSAYRVRRFAIVFPTFHKGSFSSACRHAGLWLTLESPSP
jgi:hypothetical protein